MPSRALALGFTALALLAACSAAPPADDTELTADELSSMVPGVDESALDRTVDPCNDFYDFACGGYVASLPADTVSETRSFSPLRREQNALFAQVVDDIVAGPRTPAEKKASAYVASCMATNTLEAVRPWVAGEIAKIDAAFAAGQRDLLLGQLLRSGTGPFFRFYGMDDPQRGRHGGLMAMPAGYDWGTDYTTETGRAARSAAIVGLFATFEPDLPTSESVRLATALVELEAKLATVGNAMSWESSHPVGKPGLVSAAPSVDWNAVFRGMKAPARLGDFNVPSLEFFATLDEVLRTTPADVIRAHVKVAFYGDHAPPSGGEPLRDVCIRSASWTFGDAFEPRFLLYSGVDESARRKARGMFSAIVESFSQGLRENPFLDVPTRIEAEAKLRKMKGSIGASKQVDDYADLEIDPNANFAAMNDVVAARYLDQTFKNIGRPVDVDLDAPVAMVNAMYNGQRNQIQIPAGIMSGYFFSPAASKVANFAGIGSVLAHELTHGFDAWGRHSDGNGVQRDWWTPAAAASFEQRSSCLVDQYNAFPVDEVKDPTTGAVAHVDGKLTLSENIADSGLKFAYRASRVEGRSGPTVAGFTPAQQFFVGYAQLWCSKRNAETAASLLEQDSHSPPKARVNVPLTNLEAFSRAFSCKAGSAMAPANRCTMW